MLGDNRVRRYSTLRRGLSDFAGSFGWAQVSESKVLYRPVFSAYVLAVMLSIFGILGLVLSGSAQPDGLVIGLLFSVACFAIAYRLSIGKLWLDEDGIHSFNGFHKRTIAWPDLQRVESRYVGKGTTMYYLHAHGKRCIRINDSMFRVQSFLKQLSDWKKFKRNRIKTERSAQTSANL